MATSDNKKQIDIVSRKTGLGSLTSALSNTLLGINHRGAGNPVPINTDTNGLTFFTRPRLNLSYDNAAMSRLMLPILTENKMTIQRFVRTTLDPVNALKGIDTPLVDNSSAFIPLLTNNLLSLSGWPDMTVDTYTAREGIYKESFSLVDGVSRNFSTFDLTANFRNLSGDPITLLFMVWIHYAACVYEGLMVPWPDSIIENEVDYNTRIYRLVLDPSKTYVQKIAACGAAFPLATPLGAAFNFSSDEPFNRDNDQVSIPFRCMGVDYQDPVLVQEFNLTTVLFNRNMADGKRENFYTKLKHHERNFFNYKGYPRINPEDYELEWWISNEEYAQLDEE